MYHVDSSGTPEDTATTYPAVVTTAVSLRLEQTAVCFAVYTCQGQGTGVEVVVYYLGYIRRSKDYRCVNVCVFRSECRWDTYLCTAAVYGWAYRCAVGDTRLAH